FGGAGELVVAEIFKHTSRKRSGMGGVSQPSILLKKVCSTNNWRGGVCDSLGVASDGPPELGDEPGLFSGINLHISESIHSRNKHSGACGHPLFRSNAEDNRLPECVR